MIWGLVREAVKQSQSEALIAKDLGRVPIGRGEFEIGGNDEGHALIHSRTKLEDVLDE